MSQTPYDEPDRTEQPEARAAELRDLAGPTNGDGAPPLGADAETHDDAAGAPADSPDARTDPAIDEVRSSETDDVPDEVQDPYELRSMDAQPNPSADDPGSALNF